MSGSSARANPAGTDPRDPGVSNPARRARVIVALGLGAIVAAGAWLAAPAQRSQPVPRRTSGPQLLTVDRPFSVAGRFPADPYLGSRARAECHPGESALHARSGHGHGPGRAHVAAARRGGADAELALPFGPDRWTAESRLTVCGACHRHPSEAGSFVNRPEETHLVRFQPVGLMQSRCYKESGGAFSCVTCHDPHARASSNRAVYDLVCLSCHQSGGSTAAPALETAQPTPTPCRVSPRDASNATCPGSTPASSSSAPTTGSVSDGRASRRPVPGALGCLEASSRRRYRDPRPHDAPPGLAPSFARAAGFFSIGSHAIDRSAILRERVSFSIGNGPQRTESRLAVAPRRPGAGPTRQRRCKGVLPCPHDS
jgi:hypothetical protein